MSEGHRVYLNLATHKFYCLPDNYEVIDASLADILYVLNPTFDKELIRRLETSTRWKQNQLLHECCNVSLKRVPSL